MEDNQAYMKGLEELVTSSFSINLNANDFFGPAADCVQLDAYDFKWAAPIAAKYGYDGVKAIMAFIRKREPWWKNSQPTEMYKQALAELEASNPEIWSDQD